VNSLLDFRQLLQMTSQCCRYVTRTYATQTVNYENSVHHILFGL